MQRFAVTTALVLGLIGTTVGSAFAAPAPERAPSGPPVMMSFYDDHQDAIVITDTSSRSEAKAMDINYAPGLAALKPKLFPAIFWVQGTAADGQLPVLGSEPGEDTYSPIWREVTVTWNSGVTPVLLTSDTQIDAAEAAGDVTVTKTKILQNEPVIASGVTEPSPSPSPPPYATDATSVPSPPVFMTFYDGHKDGMLATDVSTKSQAKSEGINYSPVLASLDPAGFPEIYIVQGTMAKGQLQILGSEPGEPSYSPLWRETMVRWRKGVTPTVIKSDTQIDKLIEAGKLTEHGTTVVLNCPVVSTP